jgi:hypothetical protein
MERREGEVLRKTRLPSGLGGGGVLLPAKPCRWGGGSGSEGVDLSLVE